jgi:hypothetical protein
MDDYPAFLALPVFAAALSGDGDPDVAVNSASFVGADQIHRLADGASLASSYWPVMAFRMLFVTINPALWPFDF